MPGSPQKTGIWTCLSTVRPRNKRKLEKITLLLIVLTIQAKNNIKSVLLFKGEL